MGYRYLDEWPLIERLDREYEEWLRRRWEGVEGGGKHDDRDRETDNDRAEERDWERSAREVEED